MLGDGASGIFAGVLQYRCYGNNGQHGRETYTPYQDIGNRSIAAFLMAMGPYSCEYISPHDNASGL